MVGRVQGSGKLEGDYGYKGAPGVLGVVAFFYILIVIVITCVYTSDRIA